MALHDIETAQFTSGSESTSTPSKSTIKTSDGAAAAATAPRLAGARCNAGAWAPVQCAAKMRCRDRSARECMIRVADPLLMKGVGAAALCAFKEPCSRCCQVCCSCAGTSRQLLRHAPDASWFVKAICQLQSRCKPDVLHQDVIERWLTQQKVARIAILPMVICTFGPSSPASLSAQQQKFPTCNAQSRCELSVQ